jgi:hypothetical protein
LTHIKMLQDFGTAKKTRVRLGHSPRKNRLRVFLRTPSLVLPIYSKRIKINRDLLY